MFVETCCPKCGKNSAYIRNYSHDIRTFSCCNNCGGFSFIPGFHNFDKTVDNESLATPIPAGIRCLSYKNLVDTANFLNSSIGRFRSGVNLLAAAYSYYCYGESDAYKAIINLDSNKINLTVLPLLSMHKDIYFISKEDVNTLRRNMNPSTYHLINCLCYSNAEIILTDDVNLYFCYYISYLTLLKVLDEYEEPVKESCKTILTRVVRSKNNAFGINKHICSKFGISHEKWFDAMSSFVYL